MTAGVDHDGDMKKYAPSADEAKVSAIKKYLGIALRNKDSSLVSCSDTKELARVRDGFSKKKLGLSDDAAIKRVCERMKGDNTKSRVAFYYLLAEETGTLAKLG